MAGVDGHVSNDGFGQTVSVFDRLVEFIDYIAKEKIKIKDGYQRQAMLRSVYMEIFGLHEPTKLRKNALDLVTMTNKEGHWRLGPIPRRLEDYRVCKIKDRYGMSWNEWVDNPHYLVEFMIDSCLRENLAEAQEKAGQLAQIEELMKQYGVPQDKLADVAEALAKRKI